MDDGTDIALHSGEETNYFARDFTERAERAAQANISVMHLWQAGADVASTITARFTDQAPNTLDFGDDAAEKVAGQAVRNIAALSQSGSVLADSVKAISSEWVGLMRHSTERWMNHMAGSSAAGGSAGTPTGPTSPGSPGAVSGMGIRDHNGR